MSARMLSLTLTWVEIMSLFRDCVRASVRRKRVEQGVRTLTQHLDAVRGPQNAAGVRYHRSALAFGPRSG